MTPAIVKYQGEDGMWRPCVNDPQWYSMPESSGSGFFCYGLLAGINRGILDRETYLPIALLRLGRAFVARQFRWAARLCPKGRGGPR